MLAGHHRSGRPLADRRCHSFDGSGTDVSRGEDARHGRLQPRRTLTPGKNETMIIEVHHAVKPVRRGPRADEDEECTRLERRPRTRWVRKHQTGELTLTEGVDHLHLGPNGHVRSPLELLDQVVGHALADGVTPKQHRDVRTGRSQMCSRLAS